jgi:hypothetical protein
MLTTCNILYYKVKVTKPKERESPVSLNFKDNYPIKEQMLLISNAWEKMTYF